MENKNTLYNQDVAEIFVALTVAIKTDIEHMSEGEMISLVNVAKKLSANKPQVY